MRRFSLLLLVIATLAASAQTLHITKDASGALEVRRDGLAAPLLVQNAPADMRPYWHPLLAPDGNGILTDFRPGHHHHQTGIYFGFSDVNGRSFFHNTDGKFFRSKGVKVNRANGKRVAWTVVTDWLGADGSPLLTETQHWTMEDFTSYYVIDLDWSGRADTDLTIGKYDYGGLFIRMPWKRGIHGEAINSEGQANNKAEGQRARWVDVGMEIDGRADWAHIALLDSSKNPDFPTPWRVDGNLGIVPSRSRLGDRKLAKGKTERARYRLLVYTGDLNKSLIEQYDKNW